MPLNIRFRLNVKNTFATQAAQNVRDPVLINALNVLVTLISIQSIKFASPKHVPGTVSHVIQPIQINVFRVQQELTC